MANTNSSGATAAPLTAADWLRASHALSARRVAAMAANDRLCSAPLALVTADSLRANAAELIGVAAKLPCESMAEQMLDRAREAVSRAERVDMLRPQLAVAS